MRPNRDQQQQFEVVTSTPFEQFVDVMRTDRNTATIEDDLMKAIYEYVINKVKKREEDERRDVENRERHDMDNFRSTIRRLNPPVSAADTWEMVRPRLEHTEEYRALRLDTLRESVFEKYIRRLREKESDRRHDERDRDRDRRDRDRDYRNGHADTHRRHRTRTRSPEADPYAAERRQAQQNREARYKPKDSIGTSRPPRRDDDRYDRSRRGSLGDHYGRERREREAERERSWVSRADPNEKSVGLLDYGDSGGRTSSGRRRRDSEEDASRRDRDSKVR